mmetsp:Transcript_22503/g.54888  ORF Transcript_22503/g.54888 Transcript_22503/m.54888 type:complete len:84 (+) Transcript_22503:407-658(+)
MDLEDGRPSHNSFPGGLENSAESDGITILVPMSERTLGLRRKTQLYSNHTSASEINGQELQSCFPAELTMQLRTDITQLYADW